MIGGYVLTHHAIHAMYLVVFDFWELTSLTKTEVRSLRIYT